METQHSHGNAYSADYILNLWNSENGKSNKSRFVTYKNTPLEIIDALCNDPDWYISEPAKRRRNAELENIENLNNLSVEEFIQKMGISACARDLILKNDSSVTQELFSKFCGLKPQVDESFSIEKLKEKNNSLDLALERLNEKYTNLVVECDEEKEKYEGKLENMRQASHNLHCNNQKQVLDLQAEHKRLSELAESYCSEKTKLEKKVNYLEEDYKLELEHKKYLLGRSIKLYDVITEQQNVLSVYTKINSEVRENYVEVLQDVKKELSEISERNVQSKVDDLLLPLLEKFEADTKNGNGALDYDVEIEYQQLQPSKIESEKWQTELENSQVADIGKENTEQAEKSIVESFKEKINEIKNIFI
jgi:hypothetical protein